MSAKDEVNYFDVNGLSYDYIQHIKTPGEMGGGSDDVNLEANSRSIGNYINTIVAGGGGEDYTDATKHTYTDNLSDDSSTTRHALGNRYLIKWGLFDSISHFMKLRKTIYVILDVENYLTYVLSTSVPTYGHHCLMLLFHYDTVQKKYVMNLINPHGQDSKVYHDYLLINKKDTKTVITYHFDDIVDIAIIKKLLIAFKKYTGKNVLYNPKENTYFGANLQAGDNYGICFIFPILIWYNLGVFYSTDKYVGKRKIKNMKCLLQKNNINKLVESTLAHFTSRTEEFFENNFHKADFTDMLDEYLKQKNNYLTKLMLQRLVGFIGQKAIITKMY